MGDLSVGDTYAFWDDDRLTMGNALFSRVLDLSGGYPRTVSLRCGSVEFAGDGKSGCDCSFFGLNHPGLHGSVWNLLGVTAYYVEPCLFDGGHLEVSVRFHESLQMAEFRCHYRIYPGLAAISVERELRCAVIPTCYWSHRGELSGEGNETRFPPELLESCVDSVRLSAGCRPFLSVEFRGRTDYHNEPVAEHVLTASSGRTNGNLLFAHDREGNVCLWLQEAPPSGERRDFEKHDFRWEENGDVFSCCWGIAPEELTPGATVHSYRHTILLCPSGEDPESVLKSYLQTRFPMKEEDSGIVVNPWGCRCFPQLVSESFLLSEIRAAGEIGADVYQIDDSWQFGSGLAELTVRNRAIGCEFWRVSPQRLSSGFEPICQAARESGIQLGLWCAPTFNRNYRDWREFADMLIDYHCRYGFRKMKVDGVRLPSVEAEENLESLLHKVRYETGGQVYFNLDTTNGQRPGYFLFLEYGNIFLENRYVQSEGVTGYHPEKTLRNLWLLSHYVRPQTLQIEVPAPDDMAPDAHVERDPRDYPFDYWCAIALFANMLIWTAPSRLSQQSRETLASMTGLQHAIRHEVFSNTITPLYSCPNGHSLTGFSSGAGYILVFRELGCQESEIQLPSVEGKILAGQGTLYGGRLRLPAGSYCLWKG